MIPPRHRLAALFALAMLLILAAPAAADRTVIVVGGAKGKELAAVTTSARDAVELARWTVVDVELAPERLAEVIGCVSEDRDDGCVTAFLDEASADRVLVLRLTTEKHEGETMRVVTGSIVRRPGEVVAIAQRFCERCREDLLQEHVATLVANLIESAKATLLPSTVVVRSVPAGARVSIDGTAVGVTELEYGISAGNHTLRIERDGFHPETRQVSIGDGERLELDVELKPLDGGPVEPPKPPPPSRLAPWLVVGGGAAVMVAGGVLLVVDEDEGGADGRVRDYHNTAPLGVGALVTGVAGVAVGVVWLLRSGDDSAEPASAVAPLISWDGTQALLGAQGRF